MSVTCYTPYKKSQVRLSSPNSILQGRSHSPPASAAGAASTAAAGRRRMAAVLRCSQRSTRRRNSSAVAELLNRSKRSRASRYCSSELLLMAFKAAVRSPPLRESKACSRLPASQSGQSRPLETSTGSPLAAFQGQVPCQPSHSENKAKVLRGIMGEREMIMLQLLTEKPARLWLTSCDAHVKVDVHEHRKKCTDV